MCLPERCYSSCIIGLVLSMSVSFAYSLNISNMKGEVTFDLKVPELNAVKYRPETQRFADAGARKHIMIRVHANNVTARVAPLIACQYQFPKREQIDALLSNMMNELTKVFVKAQRLILEDELNARTRRLENTRFKIVSKKSSNFFEATYKNMSTEFLELYNLTTNHVSRASRDPCLNQPLIRLVWRSLLDNSLAMLRHATRATIKEHKRVHGRTEPSTARIDQFLAEQITTVKNAQLDFLCFKFKVCFKDLL